MLTKLNKTIGLLLGTLLMTSQGLASIKAQDKEYTVDGKTMEGYVAYDDKNKTHRPAILIVPDWMGVSKFAKNKAEDLAKEGYVAFVVDMYGKGVRPSNKDEAAKESSKYFDDRNLMRQHVRGAFDILTKMEEVDPAKVVVMGYCFGGTSALELGRTGAPLAGIATFHGALSNPHPEDSKNIKAPVLVMNGEKDPFVPPPQVSAFKDEMKKANVKLEFVNYPHAMHGFTNPDAKDPKSGIFYNKEADKESWKKFQDFLKKTT